MKTSFPVPILTHTLGQNELLQWVHVAITDLEHRAGALEYLMETTHSWSVDPADYEQLDSDGAPTVITVRVDRDAWFTALAAGSCPRPTPPSHPASTN